MRLELRVHQVRDLRWGDATALRAGVLSVDRAALSAHLVEDARLASVDLALASPGESCRVGPIFDAVEPFALTPVAPDLPRVAYLYQIHSHQRPTAPGEPLVYGDNARHLLPTVVHPNEVLDGAVLPAYGSHGIQTHGVQNHPVVLELYGRHGRDLAFAGVVLTVAHNTAAERDRTVAIASNLARFALRADGVVLTKSGGGAPHVDMAELAHRCEQLGLATCLIAWDSSGTGSGDDGAALFNYPDLNAIVNFGNGDLPVALPAVERVVTLAADPAARERLRGPIAARVNFVCGAMDQIGGGHLVASVE